MIHDRIHSLSVNAMGAAIPLALSVALAIRDAVPGGADTFRMQVKTGTTTVQDEITPADDARRSLCSPSLQESCHGWTRSLIRPCRTSTSFISLARNRQCLFC